MRINSTASKTDNAGLNSIVLNYKPYSAGSKIHTRSLRLAQLLLTFSTLLKIIYAENVIFRFQK